MQVWTIYERPRDYPELFVGRLFLVSARGEVPTATVVFGNTLSEVRSRLPPGMHCIPRMPRDEPQIVEVWL